MEGKTKHVIGWIIVGAMIVPLFGVTGYAFAEALVKEYQISMVTASLIMLGCYAIVGGVVLLIWDLFKE